MTDQYTDLLERDVPYTGDAISIRALEETIIAERGKQNDRLTELATMRQRNQTLQAALVDEMNKLKDLSERLEDSREKKDEGFFSRILARLPWFHSEPLGRQSIEELLRNQYEMSAVRLKEAAEFADRLEVAKSDLYDEVDRLNRRIVESARNEELAAGYVTELRDARDDVDGRLLLADPSSAQQRELQQQMDRIRRLLAEHTTRLKLYSTAEERIAKLKENTWQLAETIGQLQADITRYVTAASEKLDLVAGQIQAIGTAADAAVVMIELQQSLEVLTASVNQTTRFVAETQAYFRGNVDKMVDELKLYDEETERVLADNLIVNEAFDEIQISDALSVAMAKKLDSLDAQVDAAEREASAKKAGKETKQEAAPRSDDPARDLAAALAEEDATVPVERRRH
jgi:hypothetical protein